MVHSGVVDWASRARLHSQAGIREEYIHRREMAGLSCDIDNVNPFLTLLRVGCLKVIGSSTAVVDCKDMDAIHFLISPLSVAFFEENVSFGVVTLFPEEAMS